MKEKQVSVVMCTYNGENFLSAQLDSILSQTYPIFELLIFDDASTDNTVKILETYALSHPIITVHKNETNIGFAANFKQALLTARGELIAISDQDDVWSQLKIETMLSEWNDGSLLIYCDSIRFNKTLPQNPVPLRHYRRFEGKDARKLFLFNTVSGHALIVKRELLALAMPFSDNIYYDWWLAVVAAYNGGVKYVAEVLVFQRLHSDNASVGRGFDHSKKEERNAYKQMVVKHLKEFKTVINIPVKDKAFLERFTKMLEESFEKKFHLPLFVFIFKHQKLLFFHKRKAITFFSNIKHTFRFSYNPDL